jgi:hypothetical protein
VLAAAEHDGSLRLAQFTSGDTVCPQRIGRRLFGSLAVRLIAKLPQILR